MSLLIAAVLFLAGGVFTPRFLTGGNVGNILSLTVLLALAGAGQTLVVVSGGGIDLSVGAVMSLASIMAVQTMDGSNSGILPSVLLVLTTGAAVGSLNALGTVFTRAPALVMTLATASVVTAVQWLYCRGFPTGSPAPAVTYIGTQRLLPCLPWLAGVGALALLFMGCLMNRTAYGRQLFAVGDNAQAARLAGVRVKRVRGAAFVLAGVLNAVAGFWFAAHNTYVSAEGCDMYVMPSIAALVIGGTAMEGGKGSYLGTMAGALVLTLLNSLLVLLETDEAGRQMANGIVLLAVLVVCNREPPIRQ